MSLISKIYKEFNIRLILSELFENTTIETQAATIKNSVPMENIVSLKCTEKKEYYELSSAQKRLYVLNQMDRKGISYNIFKWYLIEGEFDRDQFKDVFNKLIKRHESLRTSYEMIDNRPVQRVYKDVEFEVEFYNSKGGGIEAIKNSFMRPFDLSRAPLLRVGLVRTDELKHIFHTL